LPEGEREASKRAQLSKVLRTVCPFWQQEEKVNTCIESACPQAYPHSNDDQATLHFLYAHLICEK